MNGQAVSVEEELKRVTSVLEEYEKSLNLPNNPFKEGDLDKEINLDYGYLNKMDASECGERSFRLAQIAFYIQKNYNQENRRSVWAKTKLDQYVLSHASDPDYKGSYRTAEERCALVIAGDSYASSLQKLYLNSKIRAETLSFLAGKIEYMSRTLLELQQTKRRK